MLSRALLTPAATLLLNAAVHAQSCVVWSVPTQWPNARIDELIPFNNKLIARGSFNTAGGVAAKGVAAFDGTTWTTMNSGLEGVGSYGGPSGGGTRNSIAAWGGRIYAIGVTTSPATSSGGIWNGATWTPWAPFFAQNVSAQPRALFPLGDGTLLVDGSFYFYDQDGIVIRRRRLVTWNGSAFTPLSTTQYGPRLDPNFSGQGVYHAVRHDGKTVLHTVAALSTGPDWNSNNTPVPSGLITFDGTSFAPHPAPALNGTIHAMTVFNGELYVGGEFTAATSNPGVPLNHIAVWSGGQWHKCGNGLSREVLHMSVCDDGTGEKLHIFNAGSYSTIAYNNPDSTTIDTFTFAGAARFDGSRFTPYGGGSFPGYVGGASQVAASLDAGTGPALYVAGIDFQPSGGGFPITNFARRSPGSSPDTDGDGLPDAWEQNGIDIDCNGTIDLDLPALGANWRHKDIFVEVDAMLGRAPDPQALSNVVAAFAAAPNALVNNPDGQNGVALHLIVDPPDQTIPLQDFPATWEHFHFLKALRFGNAADRASPNSQAILDAKKRAFRYCIFGNTHGLGGSSGVSEFRGNDFIVTLGSFHLPGGSVNQQAATFMHELGHTLGLYHGGHQSDESKFNFKPNYHSIMNYAWQLSSSRPGWTLDYSRQALPPLDETFLDEIDGIGGAPGALALAGPLPGRRVPETGNVDWDNDGAIDFGSSADINRVRPTSPTSLDTLEGSEDWSRLVYNFRNSPDYASGDSPESTLDVDLMNQQLADELDAIGAATCLADLGATGGLPGHDGVLNNNDFIVFIDYFFAANPTADMGATGGVPGADGQFNNNDFVVFIDRFFAGC